jgi:hypothetical protein
MQPVGAPVGSHIGAMSPNRTNLLAADGLPNALAIGNGAASEEELAIDGVHVCYRRSFADHLPSNSSEDGERNDNDNCKCDPISPVTHNKFLISKLKESTALSYLQR